MGYNIEHITITLRLDNHLGPRTVQDRERLQFLRRELRDLLEDSEIKPIISDTQGLD